MSVDRDIEQYLADRREAAQRLQSLGPSRLSKSQRAVLWVLRLYVFLMVGVLLLDLARMGAV